MLYDWEAVVADVEQHIEAAHQDGRNSLGYRELMEVVAAAKHRHRVPEGLAVKALRLYGTELADVLMSGAPATEEIAGLNGNGAKLAHSQ